MQVQRTLSKYPKRTYYTYSYPDQVKIDHVNSIKDITQPFISERLSKIGYAFIRGAQVTDTKTFSTLIPVLFPKDVYDYHGKGGIYNSTRLDLNRIYEFFNVKTNFWNMAVHHDLSYRFDMPARGCIAHYLKAIEGGCTPLYDNRAMWYEMMELFPQVMLELSQFGVVYTKVLPDQLDSEKVNLWREADIPSWQQNYPNMTKSQVESFITSRGEKFEWLADGSLRQTCHLPAYRNHPETNERFYCNQILSWDGRNFDQWPNQPYEKYALIDRPTHALIGNGRDLTDEEYNGLLQLHERYALRTPWENGDIVVWDNYRISHSRDPYKGERRLAIAWGN